MRRITRQYVLEETLDKIEATARRQKERAERDAYKNSPAGQAEIEERRLIQRKFLEKEADRLNNVKATIDFKEKLLAKILADLSLTNEPHQDIELDEEKVAEVLKQYAQDIEELKIAGLKYEKIDLDKNNYQYVTLFRELIYINHIFIKFAPVEVLYLKSIGEKLGRKTMSRYKDFFTENAYFDDARFKKANKKYFIGIDDIETISDFDQIKRELKEKPELYPQVNADIRRTIVTSKITLCEMLHYAPKIVKYMTEKEIYQASDLNCALIGIILVKNPEVFENLPKDYFKHHTPKSVFARVTRADVHNALKQYYATNADLERYMHKYIETYAPIYDTEI